MCLFVYGATPRSFPPAAAVVAASSAAVAVAVYGVQE